MLKVDLKVGTLIFALLCFPFHAAAEPLATAPSYEPPIARLLIGLLLCVFLAYAVIHVLRNLQHRKGGLQGLSGLKLNRNGQKSNQITVLESHRLNATSDVCLVSWGSKEFLVIVGPHEPKILNRGSNFTEVLDDTKGNL